MNAARIAEFASAAVFAASALALLDPFGLFMPDSMQMLALAAATVAFGGLAVFVLRERAADEREEAHRALAGRTAFLFGGAVLMLGVVAQSLAHALDPWLLLALLAMVAGKIAGRLWGARYH